MKATEIQKQRMRKLYLKNRAKRLEYQKQYADNLRSKNKDLFLKKSRESYEKNKEKYKQTSKNYRLKNKNIVRQKYNSERRKHPQKFKANDKARYYITIPKNKICENCNINNATQREHRNYLKPLEVSFVCASCNKRMGGGLNA